MKEYIIAGVVGYFVFFGVLYLGAVYGSLEPNPLQWSEIARMAHACLSLIGFPIGVALKGWYDSEML